MSTRGSEFSRLAYQIVVREKKAVLKELAAELGLTYPSLYARLRGRVAFRPEEVRALIEAVPDIRLIDYYLGCTPFIAVPRVRDGSPCSPDSLLENGIDALGAALSVVRSLGHGAQSGGLSDAELDAVEQRLGEAERALATLRARFVRTCRPARQWMESRRQRAPNRAALPRGSALGRRS